MAPTEGGGHTVGGAYREQVQRALAGGLQSGESAILSAHHLRGGLAPARRPLKPFVPQCVESVPTEVSFERETWHVTPLPSLQGCPR